jgi:5-methylcytosine-specific restriction enzyme A
MPTLKRPCLEPGCPLLIPRQFTRCPEHTRANAKRYNESRPRDLAAFYNSTTWKRFRAYIRTARLACECVDPRCPCRRWGPSCDRPGVAVDHKVEPLRDWSLALDPTNVSLLCQSCHNSKTARTQRSRAGGGRTPWLT